MQNNNSKNNNGVVIIVLLAIASILVLFFPKIYDFVITLSMPKVEKLEKEQKEPEKVINEDIIETIHFPMMRNSIYNVNTYYSLDKLTINDFSNGDILLNAFLDIYEGNMTAYEGIGACTTISKQFNKEYLILRIKNIINNRINYTLENFYVPEDLDTKYVGTWYYDGASNRFIYNGLCESRATKTKYYDLEELIKMEYEGNDINVFYYVGFAKVEGNNYIIYKDSKMTEEIDKGTFSNIEELDSIYKKIDKKNKKIYKYKFKNTLCTYNEYCLYEGKWVNEI